MLKKILIFLLTITVGPCVAFAQVSPDSLMQALTTAVEQRAALCCLPVLENVPLRNGQVLPLGFCYESHNGFLSARIEDAQLRNYANQHVSEYPVCADKWCSLDKDPGYLRYFRADEQGRILKTGKFERDVVGFINVLPAQYVGSPDGLQWISKTSVQPCQITPEKNTEALLPACLMKKIAPKHLAFLEGEEELQTAYHALQNGDIKNYVAFYQDNTLFPGLESEMKSSYLAVLAQTSFLQQMNACPTTSSNMHYLTQAGYQVDKPQRLYR